MAKKKMNKGVDGVKRDGPLKPRKPLDEVEHVDNVRVQAGVVDAPAKDSGRSVATRIEFSKGASMYPFEASNDAGFPFTGAGLVHGSGSPGVYVSGAELGTGQDRTVFFASSGGLHAFVFGLEEGIGSVTTAVNDAGDVGASDTTITVDSTASFFQRDDGLYYFQIDNEIITATGTSGGTDFTGCTRGALGTTAATHTDNTTVTQVGVYTRLNGAIGTDDTTITVDSTSTFTSVNGIYMFRIGTEVIRATGTSGGTNFTGCTRGAEGTSKQAHANNAEVSQILALVAVRRTVWQGNILPVPTQTYDLGSSNLEWRDIYSQNAVTVSSDGRMKEGITDLPYGLDEVKNMRPVSFRWKKQQTQHLGFIAQDLEEVVPEVVIGEEKLSVRSTELIPVLTKAIQELSAKVDRLEKELAKHKV